MNNSEYFKSRDQLLWNNCEQLLELEKDITNLLMISILSVAKRIKADFDKTTVLKPFWENYAPIQRGHKPRGEAFPWGEVGEKVVEGHLYSLMPQIFENVRFIGLPYGHDVRFTTNKAFIHIDAKSTGPTDDKSEVVCSPNQVTGTGKLDENGIVYNDFVQMEV